MALNIDSIEKANKAFAIAAANKKPGSIGLEAFQEAVELLEFDPDYPQSKDLVLTCLDVSSAQFDHVQRMQRFLSALTP